MVWRIGNSWGSKENGLMVTIVSEGSMPPDKAGRRPDDRLVGAVGRYDAHLICAAVNEYIARKLGDIP